MLSGAQGREFALAGGTSFQMRGEFVHGFTTDRAVKIGGVQFA
jgi:hypothetical protein